MKYLLDHNFLVVDIIYSKEKHQWIYFYLVIQLTFDQHGVSSGSKAYLVPDQTDLPAITGVCESQKETSSSTMYSESQEYTFTNNFESSVSASGWGIFSSHLSFAMSSTHCQSSSLSISQTCSNQGKTQKQNYTVQE